MRKEGRTGREGAEGNGRAGGEREEGGGDCKCRVWGVCDDGEDSLGEGGESVVAMAARRLPSFHDAYVQVLAQLDTLKRVHAMQLATTEGQSSQSRSREVVRAEAGEEGEAIGNGGSMPTVEHDEIRLVVEMNEKKCVDDERSVHAEEGGSEERSPSSKFPQRRRCGGE